MVHGSCGSFHFELMNRSNWLTQLSGRMPMIIWMDIEWIYEANGYHWPAFWQFAPGWGCIPVGLLTISSHGPWFSIHDHIQSPHYITPFITIFIHNYMWFDHIFQLGQLSSNTDQRVPIHLAAVHCSTSHHPRPRRCLKQSKRQPLCSMEPLSRIRTSTGSA